MEAQSLRKRAKVQSEKQKRKTEQKQREVIQFLEMQKEQHENEEEISQEQMSERQLAMEFLKRAGIATTPYLWTADHTERRNWQGYFGKFPYEAMRNVQQLTMHGCSSMDEFTKTQGESALRAAKLFLSHGGILCPGIGVIPEVQGLIYLTVWTCTTIAIIQI